MKINEKYCAKLKITNSLLDSILLLMIFQSFSFKQWQKIIPRMTMRPSWWYHNKLIMYLIYFQICSNGSMATPMSPRTMVSLHYITSLSFPLVTPEINSNVTKFTSPGYKLGWSHVQILEAFLVSAKRWIMC